MIPAIYIIMLYAGPARALHPHGHIAHAPHTRQRVGPGHAQNAARPAARAAHSRSPPHRGLTRHAHQLVTKQTALRAPCLRHLYSTSEKQDRCLLHACSSPRPHLLNCTSNAFCSCRPNREARPSRTYTCHTHARCDIVNSSRRVFAAE